MKRFISKGILLKISNTWIQLKTHFHFCHALLGRMFAHSSNTKMFVFAHGLQKFVEKSPEAEVTPIEVLQARKLLSRAKKTTKLILLAVLFYLSFVPKHAHRSLSPS